MNRLASAKCARGVFLALAALASICLAVAGGSGGFKPLGGGFSKSSLKGQYVISQTGVGVNQANNGVNAFSETIIFTADGSGKLTATCDDFDQVAGPFGGCSAGVAGPHPPPPPPPPPSPNHHIPSFNPPLTP